MIREYIDNLIVINKHDFVDHLKVIEKVLQKLVEEGLKVNAERLFFRYTETEYLGLWVSKNGTRPLSSKLYVIKAIEYPTKVRDICRFFRIFKYYRGMWRKRAHIIPPPT